MTKTRLNQRMRDVLGAHARKLVSCPKEKAAADESYKATADAVRKLIEARFPPKDMAVLKRYDVGRADPCIRLQLTNGTFYVWQFRPECGVPVQPGQNCKTHLADEAVTAAVQNDIKAGDDLKVALEKKLADYYSLIAAATTFEAVCEVWPEAEQVRSQCGATAIVIAVTPDVVARIRADVAGRAEAA